MSFARLLVCASLLAGCIEPELQPCGDLLCAADSVCLPSGTCATQESLDVCKGMAEGATCTTSVFTGSCVMGVCTAPRCGDGVVSGSEQCDGQVSGVDCVDYGFDTGIPTCSDRCGLDVVASCVRFGWERMYSEAITSAWTNGTLFALIGIGRQHVYLYNGAQLVQELAFTADTAESVHGNGSTIAIGLYNRILRSDQGGPFVDVDLTGIAGQTPIVRVGDDGSIYAANFGDTSTRVYHSIASGWEVVLDRPAVASTLMWAGGKLYVGYDDGTLDSYTPGGSWTNVTTLPTRATGVWVRPGGGLYITTAAGDGFELVGAALQPFLSRGLAQILPLGGEVYAGGNDNTLVRHDSTIDELMNCPVYGNLMTDGVDLYIYGNGVYRFTGTQFGQRRGIGEPARDVKLFASGAPAIVTTDDVLRIAGDDAWTGIGPTLAPFAVAGRSSTDFYITEGVQLEQGDGTNLTPIALPNGITDIVDLVWLDPTSTLLGVGLGGASFQRIGTTWTVLTGITGCDLFELALHDSDVYTVGTCGTEGVIWKLSGTTWTEIHRTSASLVALWADAADNLYATGPAGSITRIAGIWHDEPAARGISISATGPGDIWVGGGPEDVLHWDGELWSRVRIVGAATPHVLATERAVYIAGASTSVLLR
ncbi:MAG TPA: hypothetical protein VLB44_08215 [Kofleriaceae bacterium]|nr:hypothetical protein [Kofleriaceae bacterium]